MIGTLRSRTIKRPISSKREARSAGISLMEVLVSITLAMVMLSSVWSLTSILTRRFESHLHISETNQMLRSLHQQLSLDFNSLIRHQSAASTLRGNPDQMTLIVFTDPVDLMLQGIRRQRLSESDDRQSGNQQTNRIAFKKIRYWGMPDSRDLLSADSDFDADFGIESSLVDTPPAAVSLLDSELVSRILTREETDFIPSSPRVEQHDVSFSEVNNFFPDDRPSASNRQLNQRLQDQRQPPRLDSISQITHFRFSYFDGFVWRSSWNSDQERQLPQAIKVDFNLTRPNRSGRRAEYDGGETVGFDTDANASELSQYSSGDDWEMESDDANSADSNDFDASQKMYQQTFIFCIGPTQNRLTGRQGIDRSPSTDSPSNPSQLPTLESLPAGIDEWNRQ